MDSYLFHTEDDDCKANDTSLQLGSWADVQAEAVRVAAEMLKQAKGGFCNHPYWRLKVSDAAGLDLLVIEVNATVSPAAAG